MNTLSYSDIDLDLQDRLSSTANIKADSAKRMRAVNRVIDDLDLRAYWKFNKKRTNFKYIKDLAEYNVENYIGLTDFGGPAALGDIPFTSSEQFYPQRPGAVRVSDNLFRRQRGRGNPILSRGAGNSLNRLSHSILEGKNYITVNLNQGGIIYLDNLDALTTDGAWSAIGDGINLDVDDIDFQEGNGCLSVDIDADLSVLNYTGIINSTFNAKDLSEYEKNGIFLLRVKLPDATNVTSITFYFGTDSSNYWVCTATAPVNQESFEVGWQRVHFDWNDAVQVGSPDSESVGYFEVRVNYDAVMTDQQNLKFDDLLLCDTFQVDLDYYSTHFVKSSGGTSQKRFEELNDTFNGPDFFKKILLDLAYHELLLSTRSTKADDKVLTRNEYENSMLEAINQFGISKFPGSKHIRTQL